MSSSSSSSSRNSQDVKQQNPTGFFAGPPPILSRFDLFMTNRVDDELSKTIQDVCSDFFTLLKEIVNAEESKELDVLKKQIECSMEYDDYKKAIAISTKAVKSIDLEKTLKNKDLALSAAGVVAIQLATAFRMKGKVETASVILEAVATKAILYRRMILVYQWLKPSLNCRMVVDLHLEGLSSFIKKQLEKYAKDLVAAFPTDPLFVGLVAEQHQAALLAQQPAVPVSKK